MSWYADYNWIRGQDGKIVATVAGEWAGEHIPEAAMRYRARLIAASPELSIQLKALWGLAKAQKEVPAAQLEEVEALLRKIDAR